jgi:CDP-diacylglycerol--serine O-phosphatidyltransferase
MNYKLRRLVPNSISSLSLVLGVLSIFMSIEKDFFHAALFIVLAMIADSLDGRAARFLGVAGGRFGIEMDSLCDLASFGVAPAIMIYQYGMTELGMTGMVISSFFTIGGALRLARFNCNVDDVKGYFQGMPIPAGACCLATYVLSGYQADAWYVAALSFGVAPAIMIYQYGMTELGMTGMVISSFFTIGGALRLARFNCNVDDVKGYFQGMPIPAGACCLATYVLSG